MAVAVAMAIVVTACADGDDYRGGVLIDTADVVVDARVELVPAGDEDLAVPAADDRVADGQREATAVVVEGRVVRLSRPATVCAGRPDVVVEVDGDRVHVRLVVPPGGEPCPDDRRYVATVELRHEFARYSVG